MTKQDLERLFEPAKYPAKEVVSQRKIAEKQFERTEIIDNLKHGFKNATIEAVLAFPEEHQDERKRFLMHVWKAYVIAMSVHNVSAVSAFEFVPVLTPYSLSRLFHSKVGPLLDESENDAKNGEGEDSDSQ